MKAITGRREKNGQRVEGREKGRKAEGMENFNSQQFLKVGAHVRFDVCLVTRCSHPDEMEDTRWVHKKRKSAIQLMSVVWSACLLYTSDAADE